MMTEDEQLGVLILCRRGQSTEPLRSQNAQRGHLQASVLDTGTLQLCQLAHIQQHEGIFRPQLPFKITNVHFGERRHAKLPNACAEAQALQKPLRTGRTSSEVIKAPSSMRWTIWRA